MFYCSNRTHSSNNSGRQYNHGRARQDHRCQLPPVEEGDHDGGGERLHEVHEHGHLLADAFAELFHVTGGKQKINLGSLLCKRDEDRNRLTDSCYPVLSYSVCRPVNSLSSSFL